MPGSNPSATDIGFPLLGSVERLLLRRHDEQTAEFACTQNIAVNPLHHSGFLSVGRASCTRAIAPGEAERAGRWWRDHDATRECGLNLNSGRLARAGA